MFLDGPVYRWVLKLYHEGQDNIENQQYDLAIDRLTEGLKLIPEPIYDWRLSAVVLTAMGDAYYHKKEYGSAMYYFCEARKCIEAIDDLFLTIRLGQCDFEMGHMGTAEYYLRVAMREDPETTMKYLEPKHYKLVQDLM